MKVFDNLKQKIRVLQKPVSFSEDDINLLAVMYGTSGIRIKNGISLFSYSYYSPIDEDNLALARDLFAKNGINMHLYRVRSRHYFDQGNILRIRYKDSKKGYDATRFIGKVQDAHIKLSHPANTEEWYRLQKLLAEKKSDYEKR